MRQVVRDNWVAFNEPLEARLDYMYADSLGLVTTGLGYKIDEGGRNRPPTAEERSASHDAAARLRWRDGSGQEVGKDRVAAGWDAVKDGFPFGSTHPPSASSQKHLCDLRIDDAEIDRSTWVRLDDMERQLKKRQAFTQFDDWPADAQLGLLSMAWAMGPAFSAPHEGSGGFPMFEAACAAQDFVAAAAQCHFTPDVSTIHTRNMLNAAAFQNAAQVMATGGDRDVLVLDFEGKVASSSSGPVVDEPVVDPVDPVVDPADPVVDPVDPVADPVDPVETPSDEVTNAQLAEWLLELGVVVDDDSDAAVLAGAQELRQADGLEPFGGELDDAVRSYIRDRAAQ